MPGRGVLHGPCSKPACTTDVDSKLVTTLICLHSRTMHGPKAKCVLFVLKCMHFCMTTRVQCSGLACLIGLCSGFILIWRQSRCLSFEGADVTEIGAVLIKAIVVMWC